MNKVFIVLLIFFLTGCIQSDQTCVFTKDELLKKDGDKVFATKITKSGFSDFRDKGKDSITSGYYCFYNNAHLKSYQYFADMKTYVYSEEYDAKGNLSKIEGTPLVHNFVKLIADSLLIKLYFFSLNKHYKKINVITSDNRNLDLKLSDDTLYSNMKIASFAYNGLKEDKDIISYIDVEYENICTHESRIFRDTIALRYTKKQP